MKEGAFVKNYFAHCVDVEEVYKNMISPVYEKYKSTYMEFTVLMFLANNPQYNTASHIVRYRHLLLDIESVVFSLRLCQVLLLCLDFGISLIHHRIELSILLLDLVNLEIHVHLSSGKRINCFLICTHDYYFWLQI